MAYYLKVKKNISYLMIIAVFFTGSLIYGQSNLTPKKDTLKPESEGFFSIPEIDYEISKIDNYLNSNVQKLQRLNEKIDNDSSYIYITKNLKKEAAEFDSYTPDDFSKFSLENSHRIWKTFQTKLEVIQEEYFQLLTNSEARNKNLEQQEKTWNKTSENIKKFPMPKVQEKKIREIQKRIHRQHNENYKFSLRVVNNENIISDQLTFVKTMLSKIEEMQGKYRSQILTKTIDPIWKSNLLDADGKSPLEGLKQAWYENTKYLFGNYNIYTNSFWELIFFSLIFIYFLFFIRKKYFVKFGDIRTTKLKDIRYVVFQSPYFSSLSIILFLFVIIFSNIPLALSRVLDLILLISIYYSMLPYFTDVGKTIITKIIILSILNSFEIAAWYLGDSSRLYLLFESVLGIWFIYPYLSRNFTIQILPHLRFKKIIYFLRYIMFLSFVISFISNIIGYIHLTVFLQKISIQFSVVVFIFFGMWNIINSMLHVNFDILSRNEKLRVVVYLPLIKKRANLFLQIFFTFIFLGVFLTLFEVKQIVYNSIYQFFIINRQLGSINFSFADIVLFIMILVLTWGINSILKMIFDEENYRSYNSVRGLPTAISMTLRILFTTAGVFFAFSAAGFDMKSFSMILGAFSVGIGFGLQNIVNDYISGLILIYERPVQKGDTVEVNNLLGEVIDIGIRRSNVRTFDGAEVIIPNSSLTSNQLVNWTLSDRQKRLDIRISVSYGSNPHEVVQILQDVAEQNPLILNVPPPKILFNDFSDSSIEFRLLCWVYLENGVQTKSDLYTEIFEAFEKYGIEIPFPQMDLHIKDPSDKKKIAKEAFSPKVNMNKKKDEIKDIDTDLDDVNIGD